MSDQKRDTLEALERLTALRAQWQTGNVARELELAVYMQVLEFTTGVCAPGRSDLKSIRRQWFQQLAPRKGFWARVVGLLG